MERTMACETEDYDREEELEGAYGEAEELEERHGYLKVCRCTRSKGTQVKERYSGVRFQRSSQCAILELV